LFAAHAATPAMRASSFLVVVGEPMMTFASPT
jgi:hypothetical protein